MTKDENTFILKWSKKYKAIQFLGGKCSICGEKDYIVLEFHHLYDKEKGISMILNNRWSKIEKELNKCILLCSNCHAEIHCDQNGRHNKLKIDFIKSLGFNSCNKCSYIGKNLASLDFHHKDKDKDKEFIVSNFLNRTIVVSVEKLYNEIQKCDLICKNCHRKEHVNVEKLKTYHDEIQKRIIIHKEIQGEINKELVLQLYQSGMRKIDIARQIGCAKSSITGILKKYQI